MPVANARAPKIHLDLGAPSLTLLHCAGLAGLYMTLKQLEREHPTASSRPGNLNWHLTPRNIQLDWQGEDFQVLDWLMKQSFRISQEGLIYLTGLATLLADIQIQTIVHQGITGTFTQHNKFFKSSGKATQTLIVDNREVSVTYKKAASYAHQNFAKHLCDKNGRLLQEPVGITGLLYPGATIRHETATKQTQFVEPPEHALALLFAPVACGYFVLGSHGEGTQYALAIPRITNLEQYAASHQNSNGLSYKYFHASSAGDAGLRFLIQKTSADIAQHNQVKQCQVIRFGKKEWTSPQKVRTEIEEIEIGTKLIPNYKLCCVNFPESRVIQSKNGHFIVSSIVRGFVADNLVKGLPWWFGFSEKFNSLTLFQKVVYERKGLYGMIQDSDWEQESYKLFIKTFHEALKITYAKIYAREVDTSLSPEQQKKALYPKIERTNDRIRYDLDRCRNHKTLRSFISNFFASASQPPTLQEHWQELLPLITGKVHWKICKDLALLALASYKKGTPKEELQSQSAEEVISPSSDEDFLQEPQPQLPEEPASHTSSDTPLHPNESTAN